MTLDAAVDQLATQMLKVSGGPAAYVDADVLASALKKIDPELPRKVARSLGEDARASGTSYLIRK